jgi:CBS domain-containing protein
MKTALTANDVMCKHVITVSESHSLAEAWKVLATNHITGAPVIDEDGQLSGVISQTDILKETATEAFEKFPRGLFYQELPHFDGSYWPSQPDILHEMTVGEIMNSEPICAESNTPVAALASRMRNHKIHRIPITNGTKLVGIVSTMDLIKVLEEQ